MSVPRRRAFRRLIAFTVLVVLSWYVWDRQFDPGLTARNHRPSVEQVETSE